MNSSITNTELPTVDNRSNTLLPLQVKELALKKNNQLLLKNVNLEISSSGITTILGDNGAGKSLLIRVLHGMIEPTDGQVYWGASEAGVKLRRRQSMVFQKPVLLRRTVTENIQFVIDNHKNQASRSCGEMLRLAGLTGKAGLSAQLLSGGEQQRLALARALVTDPDVLLLDEPTASLDPAATLEIERWLEDVSDSGVKVILVTHNIGQARRLSQDVVFMSEGTIAEHTSADAFFDHPASESACLFLEGVLAVSDSVA